MASYGYPNHGYTTSNDMDHPRYGGGYTYSDHVCKPVIIDADGRKQPIIRYTPNESYVVKRETIVKHVRVPMDEYKNYGTPIHDDKWRRPSSPIHGHNSPHTTIEHYRYGSNSPPKYRYGCNSPPKYRYGSNSPPKYEVNSIDKWHTPHYDRPHQVEEFITKVQTEASQPRIVPLTDSYRHNSAKPTGHTDWSRSNPLGWTKPTGCPLSGPTNDINDLTDSYRHNSAKPTGHTDWSRSDPLGRTKPTGRPLSGPTNDINEAVNYLKEAVKSSSITTPGSPNTEPVSGFPKKDGYMETIDSGEAKRRYGRPTVFKPSESYNGTINSKDAINKYGGAFVP